MKTIKRMFVGFFANLALTGCMPAIEQSIDEIGADIQNVQYGIEGFEDGLTQVDAVCAEARKGVYGQPVPVTVGGVIENNDGEYGAGNGAYSGSRISVVRNAVGNLVVIGAGEGAKVELLENFRGTAVFCGASVGEVRNVRGSLLVSQGNVGQINGFDGRIFIKSGTLETQTFNGLVGLVVIEDLQKRLFAGKDGVILRLR